MAGMILRMMVPIGEYLVQVFSRDGGEDVETPRQKSAVVDVVRGRMLNPGVCGTVQDAYCNKKSSSKKGRLEIYMQEDKNFGSRCTELSLERTH